MVGLRPANGERPVGRRRLSTAVAALLAVSSLLVAGCSSVDVPVVGVDAISLSEAQEFFDDRAAAVLERDSDAFLAGVDAEDPALRIRQRRYFANLDQLPLRQFSYQVLDAQWPDRFRDAGWGEGTLVPQVRVSMQLDGFDEVPVRRLTGFALDRRDGRIVMVADRTPSGQVFPGSDPAPWDLASIVVRRSGNILGVFDEGTRARASEIEQEVADGVREVQAAIPYSWNGRVVVYALQDRAVLESYDSVPGGRIDHLGAMTFPVTAKAGSDRVAGRRFTLLPNALSADRPFLARIIRHELTHIAVGARDDKVPAWLSEGIAEYVSVRSTPVRARRIATIAPQRARAGAFALPATASFNGADQVWNYALSWMACEVLVARFGEERLWELLAAYQGRSEPMAIDDPSILEGITGLTPGRLAEAAAARITRLYG